MNYRELRREGGILYYGNAPGVAEGPLKPTLISFRNGYNNQIDFKTEEEVRNVLLPLVEKRCDELHAGYYEIGDKTVSWFSDPGYGGRTEHHCVQFYRDFKSFERLNKDDEVREMWSRKLNEDNRFMSDHSPRR